MRNVKAHALRVGKSIEVTISGTLLSSLHTAAIDDVYPGGRVVYVRDPEAAQVFVVETVAPGSDQCALQNVEWSQTTTIVDPLHRRVEVFVNNQERIEVEVAGGDSFIVIALTTAPRSSCSVVPASAVYPAIYSRVFGPDTHANCMAFIAQNCAGRGTASLGVDEVPFPK
jgi:hypothetical protein